MPGPFSYFHKRCSADAYVASKLGFAFEKQDQKNLSKIKLKLTLTLSYIRCRLKFNWA